MNKCIRGEPPTLSPDHLPIILVGNSTVKPTPEKNVRNIQGTIQRSMLHTAHINDDSKTRFPLQVGNALQRSHSPAVDEREKILGVRAEQCLGTKTKAVGGPPKKENKTMA